MNFSSGLSSDNQEYNETLSWLYSQLPMFSRVGGAAYKPGLDNTIALDKLFNHPHQSFKSIHIGGTNGKGSTSHNLAAILQSAGFKTGLYTSPHLVDFRERIRIDGKMIPHEKVIDFVKRWKETETELSPSFFELTMMMAFDWFASEKVDYAIIEVGMGGRLDSTNVISPELCVVTNISLDHTQFLGTTPAEIAAEKAGIIKHDVPVVIGEATGSVKTVFEEKAKEVGAPIIFAEDKPEITAYKPLEDYTGWKLQTATFGTLDSPLPGDYQIPNLNTVLCAVSELRKLGVAISDSSVHEGISNVRGLTGFAGRWTIVDKKPLVICDTGHNKAGLSYNFAQLKRMLDSGKYKNLRIVIGFVADKAIDEILSLLPENAIYYVTQAAIPRALPVDALSEKFKERGICHKSYPDVKQAVNAAVEESEEEDIIYVGGSTFVVADFLS